MKKQSFSYQDRPLVWGMICLGEGTTRSRQFKVYLPQWKANNASTASGKQPFRLAPQTFKLSGKSSPVCFPEKACSDLASATSAR